MDTRIAASEFYLEVYLACYDDVASSAHMPQIEKDRDIATIKKRFRSEGLSFFTKTLPSLGKALDRALAKGECLQQRGFKTRVAEVPILYGWLFKHLLDDCGRERSDASPAVLGWLRQLTLMFYKLKLPYKDETVTRTITSFLGTNLESSNQSFTDKSDRTLQEASRLLKRVTGRLDLVNIRPSHGPGVVSTGEKPHEKKNFSRIVTKLDKKYPFADYFLFNYNHLSDRLDSITSLPSVDDGVARLTVVPKDSRGPRLISSEPVENQWIQQGQMRALVQLLESHHLTRGQVNFTDQTINGRLALLGSQTGEWVTLDMKEASDRVSYALVKAMWHPHLFEYLDASRSPRTMLPDGTEVPLGMFAPMGSAVCFPIEALTFWCLSIAAIMRTHNVPLREARRLVYVYGDDIICRREHYAAIIQALPRYGLKLNEDKSCTAGFFRESCGCDAYKGVVVTPTRLSCVWCHKPDIATIESWVEYSNALFSKGYWRAAERIEREIHLYLRVPYHQSEQTGGIVFVRKGWDTVGLNRTLRVKTRFNKSLQRKEVLVPSCVGVIYKRRDITWEELLYRWQVNEEVARPLQLSSRGSQSGYPRDRSSLFDRRIGTRNGKEVYHLNPLSLCSTSRVGVYAKRHRYRSQWRWTFDE